MSPPEEPEEAREPWPAPARLSAALGGVGVVLFLVGAVVGAVGVFVAGYVAGALSLAVALYWRGELIAAWRAQKRG